MSTADQQRLARGPTTGARFGVVVLGASAGGLRAFECVLGALPAGFPVPIVAVQHRARESTDAYAEIVAAQTRLPVREIDDDEPLTVPGVYLAPPDYHVFVEPGRLSLSTDEPVCFGRPSVDVLFESAADSYGPGVLGVLLTGANSDGARGLQRIKEAGGFAIVQDPHTAESPEMPAAGIARAPVDLVLPLEGIADELVRQCAARLSFSPKSRTTGSFRAFQTPSPQPAQRFPTQPGIRPSRPDDERGGTNDGTTSSRGNGS